MTVKLINPEHDPTIDVSSWKTIVLKHLHDIWKMSSPKVLAYLEIRSLLFLWWLLLSLNFRFAQNKNNQSWAPQPQASTPKHTLDRPATWRHQGESRVARKPCPGTRLPWSRHKFGNPLEIVEQLAPHLPPSHWWRIRPSAARIDLQKHIELIYRWLRPSLMLRCVRTFCIWWSNSTKPFLTLQIIELQHEMTCNHL